MDVIVKVRDPEENLEEKIKAYKVKKRLNLFFLFLAFVFALCFCDGAAMNAIRSTC